MNNYLNRLVEKKIEKKIAAMNPSAVLNGDKPRVIDEWQTVPEL